MASPQVERESAMGRPHLEMLSRRELSLLFPQVEVVRSSWEPMVAGIAVEARLQAAEYGTPKMAAERGEDPKLFKDHLIWTLDGSAADRLERGFGLVDWRTYVESCEGHKEKKAAKLGREPRMLRGYYGNPSRLEIDVDLDPIEGTDATADNVAGGMVFGAISTARGIISTPIDHKALGGNGEDVDYMDKLNAPSRLSGKVSLDQDPYEILRVAKGEYGIDPSMIVVTYLNRPRNQHVIDAVERFGARHNPIKAGDLAPGLRASLEPGEDGLLHLLMGSGGWQEGVGVAAAAKSWGGVAEGRIVRLRQENGQDFYIPDNKILKIDDLIPGDADQSMAIFAAITDIPEFGMRGVDMQNGRVMTFAADQNERRGFRIITHDIQSLFAA